MKLLTSIPSTHKNIQHQQIVINSWVNSGFDIVSINHISEQDKVTIYPKVEYYFTEETKEHIFKKHLPPLNAFIQYAKEHELDYFCLINSDIEAYLSTENIDKIKDNINGGMVCAHRCDYDTVHTESKMYYEGVDVFFMSSRTLKLIPQNDFVLGRCHFDFWLPYKIATQRQVLKFITNKLFFHKKHDIQYNAESWKQTADLFCKQEGLVKFRGKATHLSSFAYRTFMGKKQNITL